MSSIFDFQIEFVWNFNSDIKVICNLIYFFGLSGEPRDEYRNLGFSIFNNELKRSHIPYGRILITFPSRIESYKCFFMEVDWEMMNNLLVSGRSNDHLLSEISAS